jgi:hypothetical protein
MDQTLKLKRVVREILLEGSEEELRALLGKDFDYLAAKGGQIIQRALKEAHF